MAVEEALARVLDDAAPLATEWVAVGEAHGRVLAADLHARRTQPPADVSSMDGYAVRAEDVAQAPMRLTLVGEVAAGRIFSATIERGQAVRIFTGAALPRGADTIIIQENTELEGASVLVRKGEPRGRYVRKQGLDFSAGERRLSAGRVLTIPGLALAAAMNHAVVPVHRRPRVAVLSTGDELVPAGKEPGAGQIVSSNGLALTAMATTAGAQALDLGIVPDAVGPTVAAINAAREWGADVLVTAGGASVGDYDLVQKALASQGMQLAFWRVAIRPGKPLMHGSVGQMRVLGVPGNPVSAYVCGLLFLVPLIRKLLGFTDCRVPTTAAVLGRDLAENDERQDYLRSRLRHDSPGGMVATPLPVQDSSMMSGLAEADCLVVRPPFAPPAKAGEACTVIRLDL